MEKDSSRKVTVSCPFCLTLNRVDVGRVAQNPKCGDCGKPILLDRPVRVTDADFQRVISHSDVPVMVDFYADWCAPCRELDEKTFADPRVAGILDGFVRFKVDQTRASKEAVALAREFDVLGVPTVMVYRDGEEIFRITGFEPPEQFLKRIE